MALRLSTLPSAASPPPAAPADIVARAQACALARDFAGYAALFAEATAIDDRHRRHRARRTLLEAGLAAAARTMQRDLPALYLAVARAAVELLEQEPREPLVLNYAGVALYELGAFEAAEALFCATRRLDPTVAHVAGNLRQATAQRRSRRARQAVLPPPVVAARNPLAARARACARAAKPATGLTLSLCMIVKDEEEMLPRSLAAVAPAVDEIVVVDTGSTDGTVAIAESFGARVIHHEWNGSFADARNVSLDAATGDWVMYLDADEVLVEADAPLLRELTERIWREAFFLVETNFTGDLEDGTAQTHSALRVWRNRPEYRFEGRLHEQIAHALPGFLPERLESTTVRVEHYGYLGVVRAAKDKSARNIELLELQVRESGDSPFQAFNLGSEYSALGDAQRALDHFARAWRMLEDDPQRVTYPFVPSLTVRLVKALRVCGRRGESVARAEDGLQLFPGFTDLVFEQGWCARDAGERERAAELFERCLEMGDAPARYSATVGCGSYLALVALAEVSASLGRLERAERLLARCLAEHPGFLGAVLPLAAAMLRRGASAAATVAEVERRVGRLTPRVRFLLATALYEAGHAEAAEEQFRAVLERQPASGPARVALAEALLSQGRLAEAAAAAAELDRGDPCGPPAARSELFARIAGADLDGAAERLAAAPLDAHDAELFGAWLARARGEAGPPLLAREVAPLLFTMLEALLRLRDVEGFARLVPLSERVGLAPRERRELMASMYLRRGFVDSAADEWIAACDEGGPDVAALIGLAQVAAAKELPGDALVFAREAASLDPDSVAARRLAEHYAART